MHLVGFTIETSSRLKAKFRIEIGILGYKIPHFLVVFICKFLNIGTPKNAIYSLYLILRAVGGWRSWLRHCTVIRKIAGSIHDGCMCTFHWFNPSGRIMALGSTQHLKEMSIRDISWRAKAAGTTFMCQLSRNSGSLNFLELRILRNNNK